jgi:5-methylcytosine-specific restriction enzyme subunit McrC
MTILLEAWSEQVVPLAPHHASAIADVGLVRVFIEEPPNRWRLGAGSGVGVACGDGWELRVAPKLAIPQLMFLLSYASDPNGWREVGPAFAQEDDLFTAVGSAFAAHAERAIFPAPICGYVNLEDRSTTLRGRLRMADQLAKWPGQPIPLEIAHDDFTADIPENQLVRGASEMLLRMPLLPYRVRRRLLRIRAALDEVMPTPPSTTVEPPAVTRLNDRYRGALHLATLILRGGSISTRAGQTAGLSFIFDMNRVFEDFLSAALTASLERHGGRVDLQHRRQHLDAQRRIRLIPDLTWWKGAACHAVIDSKFKALTDQRFPNADAYQMLSRTAPRSVSSAAIWSTPRTPARPIVITRSGMPTRSCMYARSTSSSHRRTCSPRSRASHRPSRRMLRATRRSPRNRARRPARRRQRLTTRLSAYPPLGMPESREFEYMLECQSRGGYLIYVPELPGLATEGPTARRRSQCSATRSLDTSRASAHTAGRAVSCCDFFESDLHSLHGNVTSIDSQHEQR